LFKNAEIIVIASAWLSNAKYLEAMLNLAELDNKRVIVYKPHQFATISSLIMALNGNRFSLSDSQYTDFLYLNRHTRTLKANSTLESISQKHRVPTLTGFDAFCSDKLKKCSLFSIEGDPYLIDQAHLSIAGLYIFEQWFSESLSKAIEQVKPVESGKSTNSGSNLAAIS
jgi:hypothetical protein